MFNILHQVIFILFFPMTKPTSSACFHRFTYFFSPSLSLVGLSLTVALHIHFTMVLSSHYVFIIHPHIIKQSFSVVVSYYWFDDILSHLSLCLFTFWSCSYRFCGIRSRPYLAPTFNFEASFSTDANKTDIGFNITVTPKRSPCHKVNEQFFV